MIKALHFLPSIVQRKPPVSRQPCPVCQFTTLRQGVQREASSVDLKRGSTVPSLGPLVLEPIPRSSYCVARNLRSPVKLFKPGCVPLSICALTVFREWSEYTRSDQEQFPGRIGCKLVLEAHQDITGMLVAWSHGDEAALQSLIAAMYPELRRIAR